MNWKWLHATVLLGVVGLHQVVSLLPGGPLWNLPLEILGGLATAMGAGLAACVLLAGAGKLLGIDWSDVVHGRGRFPREGEDRIRAALIHLLAAIAAAAIIAAGAINVYS